jgi:hypothetical protein
MVRWNSSPRRPRHANTSTTVYGWSTDLPADADTYADNSADTCTDTAPADASGGCSGGEG